MDDDLGRKIKEHQANGDLVVAMSAGSLDHWLRESVVKH
jgi:UDP-N-acetylmuramate-alanine ligase